MNDMRRKALWTIWDQMDELKGCLEALQMEEEEYQEDIPENSQAAARLEASNIAYDGMTSALYHLEKAMSSVEEAI